MRKIIIISVIAILSAATHTFGLSVPPGDSNTGTEKTLPGDASNLSANLNGITNRLPANTRLNFDGISPDESDDFADSTAVTARSADSTGQKGATAWWNLRRTHSSPGPSGGPPPVPEPATMLLFGAGLIGLAEITRRGMKA